MKSVFKVAILSLYLFFSAYLVNAQEVQDKIFIVDNSCIIPQTEGKVAQLCIAGNNETNPVLSDCYEFPIGLLGVTKNSIKYTIWKGKIVSASFQERYGKYRNGPGIIAIDPSVLRSMKEEQVRKYLSISKRTSHGTLEMTYLDGAPLMEALFRNEFEELVFDFVSTEKGSLFTIVIVKDKFSENGRIEYWELLPENKEPLYLSSTIERIKKEKDNLKSELILSSPLTGDVSQISAFSIENELFVFVHDDGRFFHVSKGKQEIIETTIEKGKSYLDYSLVIDKGNEKVFLLPKSVIKKEQMSFKDMIEKHGIEIPLPK